MQFVQANAPALIVVAIALAAAAVAAAATLYARIQRFARPFDKLAQAASEADVTEVLRAQIRGCDDNQQRIEAILAYTRHLRTQALNAMQGIGFLRYDAFDDIRGQQSFSLCLLNAHRDGILFTSIAGRTDSRGYAKPVRAGGCDTALSEEETNAIELAEKSLGEIDEPVLAMT